MNDLYLKNARLYREGRFSPGSVLCHEGVIAAVGEVPNDGAPELDCLGFRVSPGFLDIHTHGGAGVDVNAASPGELAALSRFFAAQGVTGWLAGVLTDTPEQTLQCIANARQAGAYTGGARLLGVHLEGPFLAAQYKGAMPEHLLREADLSLLQRYIGAGRGFIRYLTVSPEVAGVPEMIAAVAETVAVAVGHSGADYDTAWRAITSGARCAAHTFNAMRLFHQHQPAVMGAVLESGLWCEAICDGRHLHPGAVRLLLKTKGYDRVVAVTDSMMAAGLPDGRYRLGINDVMVEDGDARLADGGSRAGSTLTMIQALCNLVEFTGQPPERLLPLLTENPAEAVRLPRKGWIQPGCDADFTVLTDTLEVGMTIVGGQVIYRKNEGGKRGVTGRDYCPSENHNI